MKFRIVLIGNTNDYKNNKAVALEINPTARVTQIGLCCPDDCIELEVKNVEEGKAQMQLFAERTGHWPKRFEYVEGKTFWIDGKFVGTQVIYEEWVNNNPINGEN